MPHTYIGNCAWIDESLIKAGTFYPADAKTPESRLRFYSSIFPTVEVDTSYYAIPKQEVVSQWVQRTPADFRFHVKAFRFLTLHWTEAKFLLPEQRELAPKKPRFYYQDASKELVDAVLKQFRVVFEPLMQTGKQGVLLFQFPSWVMPNNSVKDHILNMKGALQGYQIAVEFRNKLWYDEKNHKETSKWLEQNKLLTVCVDEPQGFDDSVPPLAEVTSDIAYVRFHGRNKATWKATGEKASERFDWYYKENELREWLPRIRSLQEEAEEVDILFNTNNQDQGPRNALLLAGLLKEGAQTENADMIATVESRLGLAASPGAGKLF